VEVNVAMRKARSIIILNIFFNIYFLWNKIYVVYIDDKSSYIILK